MLPLHRRFGVPVHVDGRAKKTKEQLTAIVINRGIFPPFSGETAMFGDYSTRAAHHHVTIIVNFMRKPSHMSITTFLPFSVPFPRGASQNLLCVLSFFSRERSFNIIHHAVDTIISSINHQE